MEPDPGASTGDFRPFQPDDWPAVEVQLDDDTWAPGDLRSWSKGPTQWWGSVTYSTSDGNHLDTFPADRIRPDTVDRRPTCLDGLLGV